LPSGGAFAISTDAGAPVKPGRTKLWAERMRKLRVRRTRTVAKRNPIARALRDAVFRARAVANRRKYTRKRKHRDRPIEGS
jgi:hypothetical protein